MLDWDHNAYYQGLLLRQLPRPCERVLDVGCGAGGFATRLARRGLSVDAVDCSERMIERARQRTPPSVNCVLGDVVTDDLSGRDYDAVVSVAALHHMPLEVVLPRLADALRPGGILAAVALPRRDLWHELPIELAATVGHRAFGAVFLAKRALGHPETYAKEPNHGDMPVVLDPPLTTREVRAVAAAVLPGARVKRLLFWRYLLVWRKPGDPGSRPG
ncbi:MAG: class I SAM-dependent methyltransferase [Actinobacteria bacterium]|nr:class I SAM-dependent methyltransferase [Actinomycetota bacterium]